MATATRRRAAPAGWGELAPWLPLEEWRLLQKWHPNVLITGPESATRAALGALQAGFRPPVVRWRPGHDALLNGGGAPRTVVVHDVGLLSAAEQQRLLRWISQNRGMAQVAATSSLPLLHLVEKGAFDSALYYALNVIYLEVSGQIGMHVPTGCLLHA